MEILRLILGSSCLFDIGFVISIIFRFVIAMMIIKNPNLSEKKVKWIFKIMNCHIKS